jgi:D-alanyl-D-alanine carboxypeptidase
MRTVADIINACDTGLAHGLSIQLIEKMNRMVKTPLLVQVNHPKIDASGQQINAYLQPNAANSLKLAVEEAGRPLIVNSMLRTTVQQHIIRTQYEQDCCGITAAAPPGRSNHEQGLALDIQDPYFWQPYLERHGWAKLGPWDDMHFDYWEGRRDIAKLQIFAFQQLWNQWNPSKLIAIDGAYGPTTARCIQQSPLEGWS